MTLAASPSNSQYVGPKARTPSGLLRGAAITDTYAEQLFGAVLDEVRDSSMPLFGGRQLRSLLANESGVGVSPVVTWRETDGSIWTMRTISSFAASLKRQGGSRHQVGSEASMSLILR